MNPTHTSKGSLFTVSAPSGAGKTSLVRAVIQTCANLQVSISHTTRAMRPGEQNGVNYHFVSPEHFLTMLDQAEFLEHAQVFNHYYGTSKTWVEQTLQQGTDVILEIDWQGAQQIRRLLPDTQSIFILPPSLQTLMDRLKSRGQDSEQVIATRTAEAKNEISHYVESDFLIVNQDFDLAVQEFKSIIVAQRLKLLKQAQKYQPLLQQLLS
jgi:guanylate kinase